MLLDVLLDEGQAVAYTRAHIGARVLTRRDRVGQALRWPTRSPPSRSST